MSFKIYRRAIAPSTREQYAVFELHGGGRHKWSTLPELGTTFGTVEGAERMARSSNIADYGVRYVASTMNAYRVTLLVLDPTGVGPNAILDSLTGAAIGVRTAGILTREIAGEMPNPLFALDLDERARAVRELCNDPGWDILP